MGNAQTIALPELTANDVRNAIISVGRVSSPRLHIIRERDVGLFSLVQQVLANLPWAAAERRLPVVDFRERAAYWVPAGYRGAESVWEYYFEPIHPKFPARAISTAVSADIDRDYPDQDGPGRLLSPGVFVSNHFGEDRSLRGLTLTIPYMTGDPDDALRAYASQLIGWFIRPRAYVQNKADVFESAHFDEHTVGVHIRGTDAVAAEEQREYRRGSLDLRRYERAIESRINADADATFFVATDAQSSLDHLTARFGRRILSYEAVRHVGGPAAGQGPTGCIMPAYISSDRQAAARNGEDAVVEYLLLTRRKHLIHNGASLAVTTLLTNPDLSHINTRREH